MEDAEQPLVLRLRRNALDDPNFDLGIVRVTLQERVGFLNRAARKMIGEEIAIGDPLSIVQLDEESRARLRAELDERFELETSSAYRLRMHRSDSSTDVKVRVTAIPELDEHGRLVGSLGIVIDESIETATSRIHKAIQRDSNSAALYAALDEHLREVLAFDSLLVTGLNRRRSHMQRLCELPPGPLESLPTKWWPMRPFLRTMIDEFEAGPLDLEHLFARPDFIAYAEADRSVAEFRARGFRHSLRLGVYEEKQLVAIVSLLRSAPTPFTRDDLRRAERLPIVEVVNAAIARDRQSEMSFALQLVSKIAAGQLDSHEIACHIVAQLATHFRWEHVSLFRVDEHRERLRLVAQAGPARLPEGYEQHSKRGLLGQACGERRSVKMGDANDPEQRGAYLPGIEGTRSELVVPLFGRSQAASLKEPERLAWLLNVESCMRDAFADEEQAAVELLISVVAMMLDRAATLELKTELVRAVADAVVQTDDLGVILHANPAAEELFGRTMDASLETDSCGSLRHCNLATLLALELDDDDIDGDGEPDRPSRPVADDGAGGGWNRAATAPARPGPTALLSNQAGVRAHPIRVLRPDGKSLRVLLSSSVLGGQRGDRIVLLTDISQQDRMDRMSQLQRGLSRISGEIRSPIALAAGFLSDMREKSEPSLDAIDKALRQLRKAMLPLEGMLRLERAMDDTPLPREPVDLALLVKRIQSQLPASEVRSVRLNLGEAASLKVQAAPHELAFCIESTLSHLLAVKAQAEILEVRVGRARHIGFLRLTTFPDLTDGPLPYHEAVNESEPLADDFPERAVVSGLMERMGGRLSMRTHVEGGNTSYRLSLPYLGEDDVQATDRA